MIPENIRSPYLNPTLWFTEADSADQLASDLEQLAQSDAFSQETRQQYRNRARNARCNARAFRKHADWINSVSTTVTIQETPHAK